MTTAIISALLKRKLRKQEKPIETKLSLSLLERKQDLLANAVDRQRLLNYDHEKLMKEKELEQQELLQRIQTSQQTISTVLDDKNRLLQEFNELQTEQDFLIQQHEEYILQKNAEIKDLEANLLKLETELQKFSSVDMEASFKKTDIFKLFDERKNPQYINKPPKDKDWQQLTALFRTHFVRYYSFIAYSPPPARQSVQILHSASFGI